MQRRLVWFAAVVAIGLNGCAFPPITPPPESAPLPTAQVKRRPFCNAAVEAKEFKHWGKEPLDWIARATGFLTTPLKHLSTRFDGPAAWRDTGCDAWGIGSPVHPTQHSTDDLYTIDVQLDEAWVNGVGVPAGTFVRLEVLPGTAAHTAMQMRRPQPSDVIRFAGPLIWDKDKRPDKHPLGHMEIHPATPIRYLGSRAAHQRLRL